MTARRRGGLMCGDCVARQRLNDRLLGHMRAERELLLDVHDAAMQRLREELGVAPSPVSPRTGIRPRKYMTTEKLHEMRQRAEADGA